MVRRSSLLALAALLVASPGYSAPEPAYRPLVLGGTTDVPAAFSSVGAIVAYDDASSVHFLCAGTLISPELVLTAAHCLVDDGYGVPQFALTADAFQPDGAIPISRIWIHPDFLIAPGRDPVHDLALVELGTPVVTVEPASISFAAPREGDVLRVVGYGSTTLPETSARVENEGEVTVARVSPLEVTAGAEDGAEACRGDSGGPAFAVEGAAGADGIGGVSVVGIVSRAANSDTPCRGGTQLTRLDVHRSFIEGVERAAEDSRTDGCSVSSPGGVEKHAVIGGLIAGLVAHGGRRRRGLARRHSSSAGSARR